MSNKSELLDFAEQNGWRYPKFAVMFQFAIGGGAVGGFLIGSFMVLFGTFLEIFNHETMDISKLGQGVMIPFMTAFAGMVIGFVPAILTGIVLSYKKFIIVRRQDYVSVFCIGTFFSLLIYGVVFIFDTAENINVVMNAVFCFGLAVFGGISAMICGKLFLPKLDLEKVNLT